jgi:predicted metalloprotease with PDZ domain
MKIRLTALPLILVTGICFFSKEAHSQDKQFYSVDLDAITEHSVKVEMKVAPIVYNGFRDTVDFLFAQTIPGTYAQQDYGRFASKFEATGKDGKLLKWEKKGSNIFRIFGKPAGLSYFIQDSYHTKKQKPKVFEPAGTNIQKGRNVVFNNPGFFGFFRGTESFPIELEVNKPAGFYGISSLKSEISEDRQRFEAEDYHAFADCPIMFCKPDTSSFFVSNCRVTVGVFNESGRKISKDIVKEVQVSLQALSRFFDQNLPVSNYNFIIYLRDYSHLEPIISGKEKSIFKILRAGLKMRNQAFGALEHGTSSFYFLPDFGTDITLKSVKDVAVHEFLHIITPLNLHSEHIGNFNYENPVMSKHLWLYEGITEYFKGLALVQAGVQKPWEYLNEELKGKIISAEKFPYRKMSFTEMSKNVLHNPYKKEYPQVYQRGALLGALLDIEIISLTNGDKTLKDVVFSLSKKYGSDRSFREQDFIEEFILASHPGIRPFFNRYIEGRDSIPVAEILDKAGIQYHPIFKGAIPKNPFKDVKFRLLVLNGKRTIKKVLKSDSVGFQKGDELIYSTIRNFARSENGLLPEGEIIRIPVLRDGQSLELSLTNKLVSGEIKQLIFINQNMNEDQQKVYNRWLRK